MKKVYNYCFVCGKDNPKGLQIEFKAKDGKSYAEATLSKEYEGYSGIIHGGIIASLLDEACVYAANSLGFHTVTVELKVRFKKPVQPEQRIIIQAEANHLKSKLIQANAVVKNIENETIAEAEGKLIIRERKN